MGKYILKRLLLMIPILLGITFIIFSIMNMIPGDTASVILGDNAPQEAREQLEEELGLNRPFLVRYGSYVLNALRGDFGQSYRTRANVFDEIFQRFPTTLKLASGAMLLAVLIGIPLGILSAVRQYSLLDALSSVTAMLLASVPAFWLGMLAILLFALKLRLLPSNGDDSLRHFILPVITLSLPGAAEILRLTRSTMLETIRQDYIRTARSKGVPEKKVIWKHALRNALLPVVTSMGMNFGASLGGAVIVETVFGMPGLGMLIVESIRQKDSPVVMAATLFLAVLFCLVMLVVDILYAYIDPRIKAKYQA